MKATPIPDLILKRKFLITTTWSFPQWYWSVAGCVKAWWGDRPNNPASHQFPTCSGRARMHLLCTCVLSLSLVLVMSSPLVNGTVSSSFRDCSQYFYMQTPPAGIRGASLKRICQKYSDKLRYATLYESSRHLPLFSAYIFKKSDGKRRMDTPWMYEPQVWICWLQLSWLPHLLFVAYFSVKLVTERIWNNQVDSGVEVKIVLDLTQQMETCLRHMQFVKPHLCFWVVREGPFL